MIDAVTAPPKSVCEAPSVPAAVEFHYTQTGRFPALLAELGASLLVNKLLVVRAQRGGLSLALIYDPDSAEPGSRTGEWRRTAPAPRPGWSRSG
ncbi:MAG TPA: hypothetical protein VLM40_05120 [Gemmata sp.]|nr:hypothetical protein [Gemmata sp.]